MVLLAVGGSLATLLLWQFIRPRIAYRDEKVLFYLRAAHPIGVPVEFVEAFFLGQGPTKLPGAVGSEQTVNLVARLSQRQTEWAELPVSPVLGNWSEGYITIRGTWCEPLNNEVIRRLNRRLKELKTDAPR
jgi:hypothetical protein